MSTRCQVKVVSKNNSVTLYHHYDGYPRSLLPLMQRAFEQSEIAQDWRGARAGKVAAVLCHAAPDGFEPEAGHELHGDLEWYYVLTVDEGCNGSMADTPKWRVDVYDGSGERLRWSGPLDLAAAHAKEIEVQ